MADTLFQTRADELDLTQREVAQACGLLTSAAAGAWFRGEVPPPVEHADTLASLLKLTRVEVLEEIHRIASERRAAKSESTA